ERGLDPQLAGPQLGDLRERDARRARRVALTVAFDGELDLGRQLRDPDRRGRRLGGWDAIPAGQGLGIRHRGQEDRLVLGGDDGTPTLHPTIVYSEAA